MMMRPKPLQEFLDSILAAADSYVTDDRAKASLSRISAALQTPSTISEAAGTRLPVCSQLAEATRRSHFDAPDLLRLVEAFLALEPMLTWRRRDGDMKNASANMGESHANTIIVGPGGFERRTDVWLGASLLAPNVRYPDHNHSPEETYLVLSNGSFRQGDGAWFEPGIGGTFYNAPGIGHAMRSGATPLFAFWLLWSGAEQDS